MTTLAYNKKASRKYNVLETFEAGIVLFGYEVKAVREGKANFEGSYIKFISGVPTVVNLNIGKYSKIGEVESVEERRDRTLLLNKKEIEKLILKTKEKGLTLVPLKFYTDHGFIKLSFGLAKGKNVPMRKEELKEKQQTLDLRRAEKQNFTDE